MKPKIPSILVILCLLIVFSSFVSAVAIPQGSITFCESTATNETLDYIYLNTNGSDDFNTGSLPVTTGDCGDSGPCLKILATGANQENVYALGSITSGIYMLSYGINFSAIANRVGGFVLADSSGANPFVNFIGGPYLGDEAPTWKYLDGGNTYGAGVAANIRYNLTIIVNVSGSSTTADTYVKNESTGAWVKMFDNEDIRPVFDSIEQLRFIGSTTETTFYVYDIRVYNATDDWVDSQDIVCPSLIDITPPTVHSSQVIDLGNNIFNITVNVTDNILIDTVIVEITEPSTTKTNYTMSLLSGDIYNKTYQADEVGQHNIKIYANDTSNNLNDTETNDFTSLDITFPLAHSSQVTDLGNNLFDIRVNATDNVNIDVVLIEIKEPSTTKTNYTMSLLVGDIYNKTYKADETGNHSYIIYANDTSGNINDTVTGSFLGDVDSSVFTGQTKNETPHINNDVNFSVTITDSNPDSYMFFHNGSGTLTNDTPNSYTSGELVSVVKSFTVAHQNYCWGFWANDTFGNSNSTIVDCFTVQNTNPTISITSPDDNDHDRVNLTVDYTPNDVDSDSLTCYLYINNVVNITDSSITLGISNIFTTTEIFDDGSYDWFVNCSDGIGHIATTARTYVLDTVNPIMDIFSPVNESRHNSDFDIIFSGEDINLYIINYTLYNDSQIFQSNQESTASETYLDINDTVDISALGMSDGTYHINFSITDSHTDNSPRIKNVTKDMATVKLDYETETGNIIGVKLKDADLDLCDFDTALSPDGSEYYFWFDFTCNATGGSHTYTIKTSDTTDELIYLNQSSYNGHFVTKTNYVTYHLDTEATYDVKQTDAHKFEVEITTEATFLMFNYSVGGLNIVERTYEIYVDVTPPSVHSQQEVNLNADGMTWNISVNATDNIGVTDVKIEIEEPSTTKTNYSMSGEEIYHYVLSATEYGTHNYRIYASDLTGNINDTIVDSFAVFDAYNPTFTNQQRNTTPYLNEDVEMTITILDDTPSYYKFFWNATGSFINETAQTYTNGTPVTTIKTVPTPHQNICWGYWANDSNDNSVTSSLDCFTVVNSIPTKPIITIPTDSDSVVSTNIEYYSTDYDSDSLTYYVYIDDVLNATTSTNITNWQASSGYYKITVEAGDGYDTSPISDAVYFTLDHDPPIVTVTSFINGSAYNYLPFWINFTTDEPSNCSLNNSYWTLNSSTSTSFSYADTNLTPNDYYTISIQCNDTLGNTKDNIYEFLLDRDIPTIIHHTINKDNTTEFYSAVVLNQYWMNVTLQDNDYVSSYNATIKKKSDQTLMWSHKNDSVNQPTYYVSDLLDITTWENTTYVYDNTVCNTVTCVNEVYEFDIKQPYPPVITVYTPTPPDVAGALGEDINFDIEVADNNSEDLITYEWKVDEIYESNEEDYTYPISVGYIGLIYSVKVTATDDSPFSLTDIEYWNITIISGHHPQYGLSDFDNIVVDGIGTAGVAFVEFIDLIILMLIITVIVTTGYLYFKKER